jgi:hypothetical protein
VPSPYDTQSHNRYSYVRNNPATLIDPSGFNDCREGGDIDNCTEWERRALECQMIVCYNAGEEVGCEFWSVCMYERMEEWHERTQYLLSLGRDDGIGGLTVPKEEGGIGSAILDFFIPTAEASRGRSLRSYYRNLEQPGNIARGRHLEGVIREVNPSATFQTVGPVSGPRYTRGYVQSLEVRLEQEVTRAAERAIRQAWRIERENARKGTSSYNWTFSETLELITTGRVSDYVGHHMYGVNAYPQYSGRPEYIRFVTQEEHFRLHNFNWRNPTHGP